MPCCAAFGTIWNIWVLRSVRKRRYMNCRRAQFEESSGYIHNLGRSDLPENVQICEKHFTHNQFENFYADKKRPLHWNAVPTIFDHRPKPKERKPPADRKVSPQRPPIVELPLSDIEEDQENESIRILNRKLKTA